LGAQEVQASVSPTPSVADLGVISTDYCKLAIGKLAPVVGGSTVKPPTGSERAAPKFAYFFFLTTLRFAGAFFFAAGFAFAFFTMLPS
jgi:hypothetical protein